MGKLVYDVSKMVNHKVVAEKAIPIRGHSTLKKSPLLLLVILLVSLGVFGIYQWQRRKVANLNAQAHSLQASIMTAKQQLTTTDNQNNGVVVTPVNVPSDEVNLLNGQVTFNMPSGWVTATATHYNQSCYIGGLAAQFCLVTSIVVPAALNNDNTTATDGGITVTVFRHSDSTNAASWFTNDFDNVGYNVTTDQLPSTTINGYDASTISPSDATPAYYNTSPSNEYYVFTNKSYIVMLTYSSNVASSTVQTFANSIKMQGN